MSDNGFVMVLYDLNSPVGSGILQSAQQKLPSSSFKAVVVVVHVSERISECVSCDLAPTGVVGKNVSSHHQCLPVLNPLSMLLQLFHSNKGGGT